VERRRDAVYFAAWLPRGVVAVSILLVVLTVVLWALLGLLLLLLLLVLGLLFIPVGYWAWTDSTLEGDMLDETAWTGTARWRVTLSWGRWLLGARAGGEGLQGGLQEYWILGLHRKPKSGRKERKPKRETKPRKRKQKRPLDRETLLAYVAQGFRTARRLWPALRLHGRGSLRFGLPDPALTGMTVGALSAVRLPPGIRCEADFVTPCLQGEVEVGGHIYGYEVAVALLLFWWHLPAQRRWRRRLFRPRPGLNKPKAGG
jgi:hypothetical protein